MFKKIITVTLATLMVFSTFTFADTNSDEYNETFTDNDIYQIIRGLSNQFQFKLYSEGYYVLQDAFNQATQTVGLKIVAENINEKDSVELKFDGNKLFITYKDYKNRNYKFKYFLNNKELILYNNDGKAEKTYAFPNYAKSVEELKIANEIMSKTIYQIAIEEYPIIEKINKDKATTYIFNCLESESVEKNLEEQIIINLKQRVDELIINPQLTEEIFN